MVKLFITSLFFVLSLFPLSAHSQASLSTTVTPQQGTLDDFYQLLVTVKGDAAGNTPELAPTSDFDIQFVGPRSSVSIINGVVNQEVTYVYRLTPKKEGSLKTPTVTLKLGSGTQTAPSTTVKVGRSYKKKAQRIKGFFLQEELAPLTAYLGQQVVHTVSLYSQTRIHEYSFDRLIYDGFWGEAIGKVMSDEKYLSGNKYEVRTFKHALFPVRDGRLKLAPQTVIASVDSGRRSPFGSRGLFGPNLFSFRTAQRREVDTQSMEVEVLSLPEQPTNLRLSKVLYFKSSSVPVGKTTLSIKQSSDTIQFGESATLTLTLRSFGNLNPINELPAPSRDDFKLYEDTPLISSQELDGKLLMSKTFRFSVVPLSGGTVTLPSFGIVYFDPQSKTYKTSTTPLTTLDVIGGPEKPKPTQPTQQLIEKTEEVASPRYEPETTLQRLSKQVSLSLALLLTCSLLVISALCVFLFRTIRESTKRTKLLTAIEQSDSSKALLDALYEYSRYKLNLSANNEEMRQVLRERLSRSDTHRDLLYAFDILMDEIDAMIYGKNEGNIDIMELRTKAVELVRNLP